MFDYFLFGSQPSESEGDGDSSEDSLDESTDEDGLDITDEGLYEFVEDTSDDDSEVWAGDEHGIVRKHNSMPRSENDSEEETRQPDSCHKDSRYLEKGLGKNISDQEWAIDFEAHKSLVNENDHVHLSEDSAVLLERGKNGVNQGNPEGIIRDTCDIKSVRGESTSCKIEFSDNVIRIVYDQQQPADRSKEFNEISRKSVREEEGMPHTQDDRSPGGGKCRDHTIAVENELSKKDNVALNVKRRVFNLIESCRSKFKNQRIESNNPPINHKSRRRPRKQKSTKENSSNNSAQKRRGNLGHSSGGKRQAKKDVKTQFIESLLEKNPILEYDIQITEPLEKHYNQKECLSSMKTSEDKACNTEAEYLYRIDIKNIGISANIQDATQFSEAKDDDLKIQEGNPNISVSKNSAQSNYEIECNHEAGIGFALVDAKGDNSVSDFQNPLKETGARRKYL